MIVGGEETLNERTLLTQVESGLMMNGADSVRFIVIHCSATQSDRDYTVEQLLRDHKVRGFRTIGLPWAQVGASMGYTGDGVRKACKRYIDESAA